MRKFLITIAVLVVILVASVFTISKLISKDEIITKIGDQVEKTTGRKLQVLGEVHLQIFPSLALNLEQVQFSNHVSNPDVQMVTIKQLSLDIPWQSALFGDVSIDKFVIDSPQIILEKYDNTTTNWQLLTKQKQQDQIKSVSKESEGRTKLPESFDLQLGDVEIIHGKLTYIDHVLGQTKEIENLNLALLLPSLKQSLRLEGSIEYMGETFTLNTQLSTPIDIINGDDVKVELDVNSELLTLSYQGDITEQTKNITGKLSLKGDSVKQLLAWQNIPLQAKDAAFNAFSVDSLMSFKGTNFSLSDIVVTLDELDIKGNVSLDLLTPININAAVNLGRLDLNPYMPEQASNIAQQNSAPELSAPEQGSSNQEKDKQPINWDDTPIDLSVLGELNADLRINSTELLIKEIKLGENDLQITIKDNVAKIALHTFKGYEGVGKGTIVVNAKKQPYNITTEFALEGINSESLLNDAAGFDKLMGKGQLGWALNTKGNSQKSFVNALAGDLNFSFTDGAVKGFNLAAIARSAEGLLKGDLSKVNLDTNFSKSEKTDFAALTGSFKVKDGVATTDNISLVNPFIRVAGSGKVDLPETKVKMKVKSTVIATKEGQQSSSDASSFTIPVKIYGPFHDVKVKADIESETKDKLKDSLKKKFKGLFGG